MKSTRLLTFAASAAVALSLAAGSVPAQAAPAIPTAASSLSQAQAASHTKAERIWATKTDVDKNATRAWDYVNRVIAKHGVNYVHTHKVAIIKGASKQFAHFTIYKGSVKMRFTFDKRVLAGPDEYERLLHYTVTVRNTTDKVAYAIDMNTHEGGPYGVHKVKY